MLRANLEKDYRSDSWSLYLIQDGEGKSQYLTCGDIKHHEFDRGDEIRPFLYLSNLEYADFFQVLVDEFANHGIFPKKENKDKIKAEAISDERKEQIDYLRSLTKEMIFKKI